MIILHLIHAFFEHPLCQEGRKEGLSLVIDDDDEEGGGMMILFCG